MYELRPYQQDIYERVCRWFDGNGGNPCVVAPTGSGKSLMIAHFIRSALAQWPETRILMLTHVQELIGQDADKLRAQWPEAPLGIYSAGLNSRRIDAVTYASIQSIRNHVSDLGRIDLVIVDEAHMISHEDQGTYRKVIGELEKVNPYVKVIGFTATPYRLGHGMITDDGALFSRPLIDTIGINEMIANGWLSPLRSKHADYTIKLGTLHVRMGDYVEKEMDKAVNTDGNNLKALTEICERGKDRRAWLIFCVTVDHAQKVARLLNGRFGVRAACISGETPKAERADILARYKAGEIRAIANVNVLSTGFDYPGIDLIAFLRPTLSKVLYVQQAGRGLRTAPGKTDCLILDFVGNIRKHGPITDPGFSNAVRSRKKGEKTRADSVAPTKVCPECGEYVFLSTKVCPSCGHEWQESYRLRKVDDIIAETAGIVQGTATMHPVGWNWSVGHNFDSTKVWLQCTYTAPEKDRDIKDMYFLWHSGYAQDKSWRKYQNICRFLNLPCEPNIMAHPDWADQAAVMLNAWPYPKTITYRVRKGFLEVLTWAYT